MRADTCRLARFLERAYARIRGSDAALLGGAVGDAALDGEGSDGEQRAAAPNQPRRHPRVVAGNVADYAELRDSLLQLSRDPEMSFIWHRGQLYPPAALADKISGADEDVLPPPDDQEGTFEITLVTLSGGTRSVQDLHPSVSLMSVRGKVAKWMEIAVPLVSLCHGEQFLLVEDNGRSLRDLGIGPQSTLTCLRAEGVALGSGRYALTKRRIRSDEDTREAVRAEFGERAAVADFGSLSGEQAQGELRQFLECLGLHGSAFVLNEGRASPRDRGGHFFMCRHSGVVPDKWLVGPSLVFFQGYAINYLELCWMRHSTAPVLADLGPA